MPDRAFIRLISLCIVLMVSMLAVVGFMIDKGESRWDEVHSMLLVVAVASCVAGVILARRNLNPEQLRQREVLPPRPTIKTHFLMSCCLVEMPALMGFVMTSSNVSVWIQLGLTLASAGLVLAYLVPLANACFEVYELRGETSGGS